MPPQDRIDALIEHYKQNLREAEIVFQEVCESSEPPRFNLPGKEICLTVSERNEFIRRYVAEIAPLARDLKRIS